ncbi:hypothetical protein V6N12_028720 [Hibiscus sabdariffa]|uniref:Uncharacterized protein n=1 Tax=Hibiscus sabdariffa TaxID=183260 RepID=A0ABR2F6N7_9ROSI
MLMTMGEDFQAKPIVVLDQIQGVTDETVCDMKNCHQFLAVDEGHIAFQFKLFESTIEGAVEQCGIERRSPEELGLEFPRFSQSFLQMSLENICSMVFEYSSHIPEENTVLLEISSLFLSDLTSHVSSQKSNGYLEGSTIQSFWDDSSGSRNYKRLDIEFSWHPKILVIARSDSVFLIDFRLDECNVIRLTMIDMLSPYDVVDEDQFLTFSRAKIDGFQFSLTNPSLVLLWDVHKSMMLSLCWAHDLKNPCFIVVIRLLELRAHKALQTVREHFYQTYEKHCQNRDRHGFDPDSEFLCQLIFFFDASNLNEFSVMVEYVLLFLSFVQDNGDAIELVAGMNYSSNHSLVSYKLKWFLLVCIQAIHQNRNELLDFKLSWTETESIMPLEKKGKFLESEDSEVEKVIDLYICSRSDVFVPAISGLFYANVAGKRIASGKPQVLVPAEIPGSSALPPITDYLSPYVAKKNHLVYSSFCQPSLSN